MKSLVIFFSITAFMAQANSSLSPDDQSVPKSSNTFHGGYEDYRRLSAEIGSWWNANDFNELFSKYYLPFGGHLYELKTDGNVSAGRAGTTLTQNELTLNATPESPINILILRDPFHKSKRWSVEAEFKISGCPVPDSAKPREIEPAFFTMSDGRFSGYLIVWPDVIQFWDLAAAHKRGEWRLSRDISDRFVALELRKNAKGILTIKLDGSDYRVGRMDDTKIADHNYEVPVFVRYTALNTFQDSLERMCSGRVALGRELEPESMKRLVRAAKTDNFFRFGMLYYPEMGESRPVMIVKYIRLKS
jgi:hypothetical protein